LRYINVLIIIIIILVILLMVGLSVSTAVIGLLFTVNSRIQTGQTLWCQL